MLKLSSRWLLALIIVFVAGLFQNCAPSTPAASVSSASSSAVLSIYPTSISLAAEQAQTFAVSGGVAPYTPIVSPAGCGTMSAAFMFIASGTSATCSVVITDATGSSVASIVTVAGASTSGGSGSSTSTTTSTSIHAVYRSFSASASDHLYSLSESEGPSAGYVDEGAAMAFFDLASSTRVALYRCYDGGQHFISADSGCEGATNEGILGYAESSEGSGAMTGVVSCGTEGTRLTTTNSPECSSSGLTVTGILGYVP